MNRTPMKQTDFLNLQRGLWYRAELERRNCFQRQIIVGLVVFGAAAMGTITVLLCLV